MNKSVAGSFALALVASALAIEAASAADGYFLIGYGARQKALAGAGVADSKDAMAQSVNPAGILGLGRQAQFGLTAIYAERGYKTSGFPRVVWPGEVTSDRPLFPVGNGAYVEQIDETSAWGVTNYANGGINTTYSADNRPKPPFGGVLGGGAAGVDLQQAFLSLTYAKRFGSISIGVAPTIAMQMINVQGMKVFAPYSSDMYRLSDMAFDWSWGGGLRAGAEWRATNQLRFGVSATTPMWMSRFDKYRGLFAGAGSFDIPASMQAGLAYDLLPNLTIMADWRHIFYSAVPALGNPTNPVMRRSLGTGNGPGFDWTDTDSASFGAEWRASNALTLRTGYHYSTNPLRARSVTVNALSPIINRHHVSGGVNYQITNNSSIDFSMVYAFKNSFTGVEALTQSAALPFGGYNPRATISPWVRGMEFTLGYNYKWDKDDHSLIPTHF